MTPTSWFIFHKLGISGSFLELLVCEWENSYEFQRLDSYVSTVKAVYDIAEPGIELCRKVIQKTGSEDMR